MVVIKGCAMGQEFSRYLSAALLVASASMMGSCAAPEASPPPPPPPPLVPPTPPQPIPPSVPAFDFSSDSCATVQNPFIIVQCRERGLTGPPATQPDDRCRDNGSCPTDEREESKALLSSAQLNSAEFDFNAIETGAGNPFSQMFGTAIASFDPPRTMVRGLPTNVKLVIGANQTVEDTERKARDGGMPVSDQIETFGNWACAELFAENFTIQNDAIQCYAPGNSRFKVMNWSVIPDQKGKQSLQVEVTSYDEKGGRIIDQIPSDAIDVDVTVKTADALSDGARDGSQILDAVKKFWWALVGFIVALIAGVRLILKRAKPS